MPRSAAAELRIGEVAERVGLSRRTVRFYEQAGLLTAVARTAGRYRQYDRNAVERLQLIKRMRLLGFALVDVGALLSLRDDYLQPDAPPARRPEVEQAMQAWIALAEQRLAALREQAEIAQSFVDRLRSEADRLSRA